MIDPSNLDKHVEHVLPEIITNLSHVAPAVRKGAVDVLKIYLKYTRYPNEFLKTLVMRVPENSHLMQGLLMAIPSLLNHVNEDTSAFLLRQLFLGLDQEFLKETALTSLVKAKNRFGEEKFNKLMSQNSIQQFDELCKEQNVVFDDPKKTSDIEDNVILETEITLDTGPAITMKIHEEITCDNQSASEESTKQAIDEPNSDFSGRSPRKVRFGGEIVKMRTPESDSNNQSSDDNNDTRTSLIIDRPTSIKITVGDGVAAIKTRHRSKIPVRITTGSNPATPKKKLQITRLHKSAPELRPNVSKIPLKSITKKVKTSPMSKGFDLFSGVTQKKTESRWVIAGP